MTILLFLLTGFHIEKFFTIQYQCANEFNYSSSSEDSFLLQDSASLYEKFTYIRDYFMNNTLYLYDHSSSFSCYQVGIDDLALVWSLLLIGPFVCNIFQVFILKPFLSKYLGNEEVPFEARKKFFKDGWILFVLLMLNTLAFFSFNSEEWFCAWFPWFCDTGKIWWLGYPSKPLTIGTKWYCLLIMANDGFAVLSTCIDILRKHASISVKTNKYFFLFPISTFLKS